MLYNCRFEALERHGVEFGSCNVNRKTVYPLLDNRMVNPIYAWMPIYKHTDTNTQINMHTHTYTHTHTRPLTHAHTHTYKHTHICLNKVIFTFLKPSWSINETPIFIFWKDFFFPWLPLLLD